MPTTELQEVEFEFCSVLELGPNNKRLIERRCCFTSTETGVGLLGTGAQGGHLDFEIAPEL